MAKLVRLVNLALLVKRAPRKNQELELKPVMESLGLAVNLRIKAQVSRPLTMDQNRPNQRKVTKKQLNVSNRNIYLR